MEQKVEVEGNVLVWVVDADVHVQLLLAKDQSEVGIFRAQELFSDNAWIRSSRC